MPSYSLIVADYMTACSFWPLQYVIYSTFLSWGLKRQRGLSCRVGTIFATISHAPERLQVDEESTLNPLRMCATMGKEHPN